MAVGWVGTSGTHFFAFFSRGGTGCQACVVRGASLLANARPPYLTAQSIMIVLEEMPRILEAHLQTQVPTTRCLLYTVAMRSASSDTVILPSRQRSDAGRCPRRGSMPCVDAVSRPHVMLILGHPAVRLTVHSVTLAPCILPSPSKSALSFRSWLPRHRLRFHT